MSVNESQGRCRTFKRSRCLRALAPAGAKLVRVRLWSSQRKELAMAHPQFGLQQESGEAAAEADEFMKCRRGGNGALSCGL